MPSIALSQPKYLTSQFVTDSSNVLAVSNIAMQVFEYMFARQFRVLKQWLSFKLKQSA
jgi:hypothetical protein